MEKKIAKEKVWTWYKGLHGYAVFNNKYKYVSHYEESMINAIRICNQWNREQREF